MTAGTRPVPSRFETNQTRGLLWSLSGCLGTTGSIGWMSLALVSSLGCQAILPSGFMLSRQAEQEASPDTSREIVLIDRTGKPLPGEQPAGSTTNSVGPTQPTTETPQPAPSPDPKSIPAVPESNVSNADGANRVGPELNQASPTQNLVDSQPTNPEVPLVPPSTEPASQATSRAQTGSVAQFGPSETSANSSPAAVSTTAGQGLRVAVVADASGPPPSEGIPAADVARSEAMAQAIQQVTQRGLGRIAGGRSDDAASPALANLLLDQVQQSVSSNQIQQASLALQDMESSREIPAFDLNTNRPINAPNHASDLPGESTIAAPSATTMGDAANVNVEWRPAIKQAIQSIERSIAQTSNLPERESLEVYLRLLRLISQDPDQAVRSIESLPKQRQNFWREQIFALSQIIQAPESDQDAMFVNHSRQATKALAHLQNAVESLKSEATLQLRQVQFCQEIRSFGDYDVARTTVVSPGDPMLIYCEVLNYLAQPSNDMGGGHYQASLVPSYTIFDDRQQMVSQKEFAVVRDRCRSRRNDFYLVLQVEVPELSNGKYHLQVSVEDLEANKIAVSAPISFQIRTSR
jgi:hypothetical protein